MMLSVLKNDEFWIQKQEVFPKAVAKQTQLCCKTVAKRSQNNENQSNIAPDGMSGLLSLSVTSTEEDTAEEKLLSGAVALRFCWQCGRECTRSARSLVETPSAPVGSSPTTGAGALRYMPALD